MRVIKHSDLTAKNLHGSSVSAYLGLAEGIVLRATTMAAGDVREEDRIPAEHVQLILKGNLRVTDGEGNHYELEPMDAIGYSAGEYRKTENLSDEDALILIVDHGSPHDTWGPGGPRGPGGPGGPGPGVDGGPDSGR